MATVRVPVAGKPKGKGKGAGPVLIAGKPAWLVLGGGAVGLALLYLLYKRYKGGAGTGASVPGSAPAADTSGGAGSSAATPADLTPYTDLAAALNGLTYELGGGGGGNFTVGGQPGNPAAPSASASAPVYPLAGSTGNVAQGGNIIIRGVDTGIPDTAENAALVAAGSASSAPLAAKTYTTNTFTTLVTPAAPVSHPSQTVPAPPTHAATKVLPTPAAKNPAPAAKKPAPATGVTAKTPSVFG